MANKTNKVNRPVQRENSRVRYLSVSSGKKKQLDKGAKETNAADMTDKTNKENVANRLSLEVPGVGRDISIN